MSKLLVTEKEIVVPGQELAEGMDYLPGVDVFREKDKLMKKEVYLGSEIPKNIEEIKTNFICELMKEKYFDLFAVWTRLPRYSWDFCNLGVVNGCIVRNAVYGEGDTKSIYNDPSICAN